MCRQFEQQFVDAGLKEGSLFLVDSYTEGDQRDRGYWFRNQIVEVAKQLDYFANTGEYRSWLRICLKAGAATDMLFSFHGVGREFRGVIACSSGIFQHGVTEERMHQATKAQALCDDIFQINYLEPKAELEKRFDKWFEDSLNRGLAQWEQSL